MSLLLSRRLVCFGAAWLFLGACAAGIPAPADAGNSSGGSGGSAMGGNGGVGGAGGTSTGGAAGGGGGSNGGAGGGGSGGGGAADASHASDVRGVADVAGSGGAGGGVAASGICEAGAVYGAPLPADKTAKVIKGGAVLEGPVWVESKGALYYTEFTGISDWSQAASTRIMKFTPPDKFETFVAAAGCNGLALSPDGKSLVAATHDTQSISLFDLATGKRTQVPGAGMYMGNKFISPNDLTVRPDGNIYFTDPNWQQHGGGQPKMGVYQVSPAGVVTAVEVGLFRPNGIALSPDGNWIYAGSGTGTKKYKLDANGKAGPGLAYTNSNGDGMAVDCAGNTYISGGSGVQVVAPDGKAIGTVSTNGAFATNAAFGGADRKTLYITSYGGGLLQIKLNVPGFPY